jgi:hypothetical protein
MCAPDIRSELGACVQAIIAAQVVQSVGGLKAEIDILVSPIPKHITCNMEDFRTPNTVFDQYSLS